MCLVMQAIWDPRLAFTGTTILGVNPENGQHYFKPLHAAFCKCGCYSTAGNNMSTLHCCFTTGISCAALSGGPCMVVSILLSLEG